MEKIVGVVVFLLFVVISVYAINRSMEKTQDGWIRYDMKHGMVESNNHPVSLSR